MAVKKSETVDVRNLVDAMAIAMRAGLLTPSLQDEQDLRAIFGLRPAPQEVVDDWKNTDGVRKPNTLRRSVDELEEIEKVTDAPPEETNDDEE
jgi:hypothetical protein